MDLSLIANLEDIPAVQNYLDKNSPLIDYNSPLYQAQQQQMAYMAMKQRKPMVIEYFDPVDVITVSGGGSSSIAAGSTIGVTSVEMYINPERLVMQTQKLKSKTVTRGGVFYHHAGDDHWTMQLSGTVGLSGMRGIEQLEKIYYHSGALLKYTDLGPDKVQSEHMPSTWEQINLNDPFSGINYILNNDVNFNTVNGIKKMYERALEDYSKYKDLNNQQSLNTKATILELCLTLVKNYQNVMTLAETTAGYNKLYMELNSYVSSNTNSGKYIDFKAAYQECQRMVKTSLSEVHPTLQVNIAYDLARTISEYQNDAKFDISILANGGAYNDTMKMLENSAYSYVGDSGNVSLYENSINEMYYWMGKLRSESLSNYINEVQAFNEKNKINTKDASMGWLDIRDEMTDIWRPRQIFIYFEDRVYIGHFDSFSWQREAGTPLIRYDMRFTVTRQIIVTSTGDKPSIKVPTKQDGRIPMRRFDNTTTAYSFTDKLKYYSNGTSTAVDDAKREILRIKEAYLNEKEFDALSGGTLSSQRLSDINKSLSQIRQTINMAESDPLYGIRDLAQDQRLQYYSTADNNVDALNAVKMELSYVKALIANKKQKNALDPTTKQTIAGWLVAIHQASGITEIQSWEYEIM